MTKNNQKKNLIVGVLTLLIYCCSLSPFFIPHNHNHDHKDSSYCESTSQNSNSYLGGTDNIHLRKAQEKCLLCDHSAFFDHLELNNVLELIVQLSAIKNEHLVESLYLQGSTNYTNKSPPFTA